jgi:predicted membrane-bound mannosyltransferase
MTTTIDTRDSTLTLASLLAWLTVERLAYIAIGLLALIVRMTALGAAPMAPGEAAQATAALAWIEHMGALPAAGASPLLLSLHGVTFMVTHATEASARLWPALAGTLLVLLAYGLRSELGRLGALAAALLLAVSSSLVFWSRSATGESVALLAAMALIVGLAGWRRDPALRSRWALWLAVALALLLLSAPAAYAVLVLIAPLAALALWPSPRQGAEVSSQGQGLRAAVITFGVLVLLGATAMFFNPSGLASLAELPAAWLQGFTRSAGSGPLWLLALFVVREPLIVATGLAGLVLGLRRRNWLAQGLGLWLVLGLLLFLVRAGRSASDLALLALPLAVLGGAALAALVAALRPGNDEQKAEAAVLFVAGLTLFGATAVWLATWVSSWSPEPQMALLASAGVALLVLGGLLAAYAVLFGGKLTLKIGLAILIVALALPALRATMDMSHSRDGLRWGSFLSTAGAADGGELTAFLERYASQRGGDLQDLPVVLIAPPGQEPSPLVRWLTRDAAVREAAGIASADTADPLRGAVYVSLVDDAAPQAEGYSGRSFRIARTWMPEGLRGKAFWNWLLYGHFDALDGEQRAIVWVRAGQEY